MILRELITKLSFQTDNEGLKNLEKQLEGLQSTALKFGLAAGAAIAGVTALAAKTQAQVRRAALESGLTGKAFDDLAGKLQEQALRVSETLGVSTADAAKVFAQAIDRGIDPASAKFEKLNEVILKVAKVAEVDGAQAFDSFGKISQQLFGNFDQIDRIANVVQATTIKTTASFESLSQAMVRIGPIAARTNTTVEEFAAILGSLEDSGIPARRAMGSLTEVMNTFINPSAEAQDIINKLGLNMLDANGRFVSFIDVISQLETATVGMTDVQKDFVLQQLAGAQGATVFGQLLKKGSKELRSITKDVTGTNVVNEQFEELMQGAGEQTTRLMRALSALGSTLGTPFLQPLTNAASRIADIIAGVRKWIAENDAVVGPIIRLAGIVVGLVLAFGGLSFIIAKVIVVGKIIAALFTTAALTVVGWVAAIGALLLVMEDLWVFLNGGDSLIGRLVDGWIRWNNQLAMSSPILATISDTFRIITEYLLAFPRLLIDAGNAIGAFFATGDVGTALKDFTKDGSFTDRASKIFFGGSQNDLTQAGGGVKSNTANVTINATVPPGTNPDDVGQYLGGVLSGEMEKLSSTFEEFEPSVVQ